MEDEPETGMELDAKVGVIKEIVGEDIHGFMFHAPE